MMCDATTMYSDLPDLCVVSTNVRKCSLAMSSECFGDILRSASQGGCVSSASVVLLQECDSWAGQGRQFGSTSDWHLFGLPHMGTAMCVRSSFRTHIRSWGALLGVTWVSTATHLILSCYLPARSKGIDDYTKAMGDIQKIIKAQRGRGRYRRRVILGGDLNETMPRGLAGITGMVVPHRGRRHTHSRMIPLHDRRHGCASVLQTT